MEPPMPNCSMRHQNPVGDFDDTGHFLQGALCTIAAQMRFPLYPTARVPRRRYTLYLVLGYGGDLLIAFLKNYRYGLPRFCAAALVAGSLSRTLRQGMAALNAQFMSAFTAAPL